MEPTSDKTFHFICAQSAYSFCTGMVANTRLHLATPQTARRPSEERTSDSPRRWQHVSNRGRTPVRAVVGGGGRDPWKTGVGFGGGECAISIYISVGIQREMG